MVLTGNGGNWWRGGGILYLALESMVQQNAVRHFNKIDKKMKEIRNDFGPYEKFVYDLPRKVIISWANNRNIIGQIMGTAQIFFHRGLHGEKKKKIIIYAKNLSQ
jgi:hypothetical protein